MPADGTHEGRDEVADLFAEFTWSRARAAGAGEPPPAFDVWVRAHPEHERALREHHARWLALDPLVERLAFESGSISSRVAFESAADAERLLQDIALRKDATDRYEILEEVGQGGMGVVFKVWDRHLARVACMKVLRRQWHGDGRSGIGRRALRRFVEEARIASRLAHPGIVPIHELGCDAEGRVWFTMAFVEGRDLGRVLHDVHRRGEPLARVVAHLLRACEAVAFAHDHGVLHRDLKPANIRVGEFGQVYVMDWGLARLMEREPAEPEPAGGGEDGDAGVADADADVTTAGQALGTIAYMAPEQARGELDAIGPRSDVYSLGAVLYEILGGRRPYHREGATRDAAELLALVRGRAPDPLPADVAPDLAAICAKAMQRDPELRYAGAEELARDLRACLEGRVVAAHRTDRIERAARWVRRNRGLAASLATVLVLSVAAASVIAVLRARSRQAGEEVFRLAARQELEDLRRRADQLWPAAPALVPQYEAWIADADALLAGLPQHRATLADLEARARTVPLEEWLASHPTDPDVRALAEARADVALLEAQAAEEALHERETPFESTARRAEELEASMAAVARLEFDEPRDRWWRAQLQALVDELEALADPERGLLDGVSGEHGWGVRRRLAFVRARAPEDEAWREAAEAIAAHPRYAGLRIRPQDGLVPIGPDPASGLWEFAHPQSGEIPARDPGSGALTLDGASGLVFVLIPGGSFEMGAESDPSRPHFDAGATRLETPKQPVTLAPFFLAKHELTQGQWLRATGQNPSYYGAGSETMADASGELHPVENVTWDEVVRVLGWLGVVLPTEAQWEYAARAGTRTIWFTGDDRASLAGHANLSGVETQGFFVRTESEPDFEDPWITLAPVNGPLPNPFGVHGMIGNVAEWCRDKIGMLGTSVRPLDGRRLDETGRSRVLRGSSFYELAQRGTSSARRYSLPTDQSLKIGCRAARAIE